MSLKISLELDDNQKELFQATAADKNQEFHDNTESNNYRNIWAAQFGGMLMQTLPINGTVRNIYDVKDATNKRDMMFMIEPNDVTAWVAPSVGSFVRNYISADMLYIPTQIFASSVYYSLDFASDADFDVPTYALQKLNDSLLRIEEQEGWMLLRTAVNNSNSAQKIQIEDGTIGAGYFSLQLFSAIASYFERNAKTIDAVYVPSTSMGDVRSWASPRIDPQTQRQIIETSGISRIYNINLVPLPPIVYYKSREDKKARRKSILDRMFSANDKLENGADVWSGAFKIKYAAGLLDVCYGISYDNLGIYAIKENVKTVSDPVAIMTWEQGIVARFRAGFAIVDHENIVMGIVDRETSETL